MNNESIICPKHSTPVYPFISKKGEEFYICKTDVKNLKNGQIGKGHFLTHPDDESSLTNYFDHYDEIERREHE